MGIKDVYKIDYIKYILENTDQLLGKLEIVDNHYILTLANTNEVHIFNNEDGLNNYLLNSDLYSQSIDVGIYYYGISTIIDHIGEKEILDNISEFGIRDYATLLINDVHEDIKFIPTKFMDKIKEVEPILYAEILEVKKDMNMMLTDGETLDLINKNNTVYYLEEEQIIVKNSKVNYDDSFEYIKYGAVDPNILVDNINNDQNFKPKFYVITDDHYILYPNNLSKQDQISILNVVKYDSNEGSFETISPSIKYDEINSQVRDTTYIIDKYDVSTMAQIIETEIDMSYKFNKNPLENDIINDIVNYIVDVNDLEDKIYFVKNLHEILNNKYFDVVKEVMVDKLEYIGFLDLDLRNESFSNDFEDLLYSEKEYIGELEEILDITIPFENRNVDDYTI